MAQVDSWLAKIARLRLQPLLTICQSIVCEFADIGHTMVAQNSRSDSVLSLRPPISSCR